MSKIDDPIAAARGVVAHGPNTAYPSRVSGQYVRDVMAALLDRVDAEREASLQVLAGAMRAFAPDLAEQLVQRWKISIAEQDKQLEEFLAVLRSS